MNYIKKYTVNTGKDTGRKRNREINTGKNTVMRKFKPSFSRKISM